MNIKVLTLLFGLFTASSSSILIAQDSVRTQVSGVYTAKKTGHLTPDNTCSPIGATCVYLSVSVPLGSQIVAVHCLANIDPAAGPDLAHGQFNEVSCGKDQSWSMFSPPVTQTSNAVITISSTFFNRSNDRDRDVKMIVDFMR